jgi:hypothetical protein
MSRIQRRITGLMAVSSIIFTANLEASLAQASNGLNEARQALSELKYKCGKDRDCLQRIGGISKTAKAESLKGKLSRDKAWEICLSSWGPEHYRFIPCVEWLSNPNRY